MKRVFIAGLVSSGFLLAGDLKIEDPWVRAVPPSAQATAAFMTIRNTGDKAVTITGATSPVAAEVEPMITTKQGDGVMGMDFVESFTIPAGGKRILEPGGDHLMLMKLNEVPKAGSKVPLILQTECEGKAASIKLEIPVR
jgi:copper(I)-binding protein